MNKLTSLILTILTVISVITLSGCRTSGKPITVTEGQQKMEVTPGLIRKGDQRIGNSKSPNMTLPKAVIYKMSGNYAENVPVALTASGELLSYPAPTDLSDYSMPIELGKGWFLTRMGVSTNSVFTKYTFKEYRALPSAPTQKEIMSSIIPGARVVKTISLPMTPNEAAAIARENPEQLLEYVK